MVLTQTHRGRRDVKKRSIRLINVRVYCAAPRCSTAIKAPSRGNSVTVPVWRPHQAKAYSVPKRHRSIWSQAALVWLSSWSTKRVRLWICTFHESGELISSLCRLFNILGLENLSILFLVKCYKYVNDLLAKIWRWRLVHVALLSLRPAAFRYSQSWIYCGQVFLVIWDLRCNLH